MFVNILLEKFTRENVFIFFVPNLHSSCNLKMQVFCF